MMTSLLLVAASSLNASTCSFQIVCQAMNEKVVLEFSSPSKDCTEDDMQLTLSAGEDRKKIVLQPAWYAPIGHVLKGPTDCLDGEEPVSGFKADKDLLLVFLTSSGRPGYDDVHAVLFNLKQRKMLSAVKLGKSKESMIPVFKSPHGYKLRIVREHLAEVQCDCSAAFADDWLEVRIDRDKLVVDWL